MDILTPKEIKKHLDMYVVGQDDAKIALSNVAFLHLVRKRAMVKTKRKEPYTKSTLLLIGPTGVGKTYMIKTLSKLLSCKVHTINAKDVVSEGYKGTSMGEFLYGFSAQHETNQGFEDSIIFIDELDKIATTHDGVEGFNLPVQQQLLKIIEGCKMKGRHGEFDTSKMLFVLGGNFKHMRDAEKQSSKSIGFLESKSNKQESLHQRISKSGMLLELAGRITVIAELYHLGLKDLLKIMRTKDSVVAQYREILDLMGVDPRLDSKSLKRIAQKCLENKTGARGLHTELESHLFDIIHNITKHKINKLKTRPNKDTIKPPEQKRKEIVVGPAPDIAFYSNYPYSNAVDMSDQLKLGSKWRLNNGLIVQITGFTKKDLNIELFQAIVISRSETDKRLAWNKFGKALARFGTAYDIKYRF